MNVDETFIVDADTQFQERWIQVLFRWLLTTVLCQDSLHLKIVVLVYKSCCC